MLEILINTCLNEVEIALFKGERLVGLEKWEKDKQEASKIIPAIDKIFKETSFKKEDLGCVYLVNGPGAFTSIRIGHIVAKALAENLNIPLKACSTFEYILERVNGDYETFLLNAGGQYVYEFEYKTGKEAWFEIKELKKEILEGAWYSLSKKQIEKVGLKGNNDQLADLDERWQNVKDVMVEIKDFEKFEPNYIKEPNIT